MKEENQTRKKVKRRNSSFMSGCVLQRDSLINSESTKTEKNKKRGWTESWNRWNRAKLNRVKALFLFNVGLNTQITAWNEIISNTRRRETTPRMIGCVCKWWISRSRCERGCVYATALLFFFCYLRDEQAKMKRVNQNEQNRKKAENHAIMFETLNCTDLLFTFLILNQNTLIISLWLLTLKNDRHPKLFVKSFHIFNRLITFFLFSFCIFFLSLNYSRKVGWVK